MNTVTINGLTVEQKNGTVLVNGKPLTDEQLGKPTIPMDFFKAALLFSFLLGMTISALLGLSF